MNKLHTIRVLWHHPYNDGIYGLPYELRPGQAPSDLFRRSAKREVAVAPTIGTHHAWFGEVVPSDWIRLDPINKPEDKAWLAALEQRYPGMTPARPHEWIVLPRAVAEVLVAVHQGVVFLVGPRTPYPGIGWKIETYDHLGRTTGYIESQGAFYDNEPDHPEGAYAWASAACKTYIDNS